MLTGLLVLYATGLGQEAAISFPQQFQTLLGRQRVNAGESLVHKSQINVVSNLVNDRNLKEQKKRVV